MESNGKIFLQLTPNDNQNGAFASEIEIVVMALQATKEFIFSSSKGRTPTVTYQSGTAPLSHVFETSYQTANYISLILKEIKRDNSFSLLEAKAAEALKSLHSLACKKNISFTLSTSVDQVNQLKIQPDTENKSLQEDYLRTFLKEITSPWEGVEADNWVNQIRGNI